MVDSIRPTYHTVHTHTTTERIKKPSDVQTPTDDKDGGQAYVTSKDRRKNKDRRDRQGKQRSVYDMRSSSGRRQDDKGQPSIEIDV